MTELWAGIDIGGSKTLALLCDAAGSVVAEATAPTAARAGGSAILATAAALVRELSAGAAGRLVGAGVGAAGVISTDGHVLASSNTFAGWIGTDIAGGLAGRLGLPVAAENDARAFLRGEVAEIGGVEHALGVIIGTGVGGALLVDGRILRGGGATGAGEIGHVGNYGDEPCSCGRRGHLEAYVSGKSISRRHEAATGVRLAAEEVAAIGDPVGVFADAGRVLGQSVAYAAGLLGVELVLLGGGVMGSWWLMEAAVVEVLERQRLLSGGAVKVERSRLGRRAVAVGAAELARNPGNGRNIRS
ncbi:ROK family protein [Fodinicola acaciae]|uniref:ROK family protein n=1 Tax=Fodinicola acaciae TaxID=2681555 RepID=UPI0013D41A68